MSQIITDLKAENVRLEVALANTERMWRMERQAKEKWRRKALKLFRERLSEEAA